MFTDTDAQAGPQKAANVTRVKDIGLTYKFEEPYGEKRLRELILYIAEKCQDDPTFGATKLNKILYFADFISFSLQGDPISGVEYMRLGQGPVPKRLLPVSKQMQRHGEIAIKKADYFGHEQQRMVPLREANIEMFKARDIAILDEVIRVLWGQTADAVSRMSHGTAWKIVKDRESIPYEASFLANVTPSVEDIGWAQELIDKYGW